MSADFKSDDFLFGDFKTLADPPELKFSPTQLPIGQVNVGESTPMVSYNIYQENRALATARNISISIIPSINSNELVNESWVYCSTAKDAEFIGSEPSGKFCACPSIVQSSFVGVKCKVIVPITAVTSGFVSAKFKHLYQYTG